MSVGGPCEPRTRVRLSCVDVSRVVRAVLGFLAAGWGVALLLFGILVADRLAIAIVSVVGGVLLVAMSYALYRLFGTSQTTASGS